MMKKSGKHRNPTGTTGNYLSPRWGEKTKTKVTPAKESETKGSRQIKSSFPRAQETTSALRHQAEQWHLRSLLPTAMLEPITSVT
jgi:hypothetical protein